MKQALTAIFLFIGFLALAQPVNDDCSGLIDLGVAPFCPEDEFFTNVDATASDIGFGNNPDCFNGGTVQNDVWFAFTTSDTIFDYTITVMGADDGMGGTSIVNPQIALYRGDCTFDGLAELLCVSADEGETTIELDAEGLTPNVTYFIRVNDYSSSGTPNWGTFKLCVDEQDPISFIDEGGSTACSGELYDSGGPDGDYSNGENNVFVICPNQPNQCINFTLEYYNIEFSEFTVTDQLNFYDGDGTNPNTLIANIGGTDFNTEITDGGGVCQMIQASSGCLTVEFISDGASTFEGFAGSWECSSQACDLPDPISVDTDVTEEDIVDALSTPQTTFTITNITCDEGSYGTFQAGDNTDLGLERGLLLTTGDLNWAVGPNTDEGGGNPNDIRNQPGDPDLDSLSILYSNGSLSNDACVLELDVTAATDELTFEYIFGSDEYTEFVGTTFNDIFAFLISGPGIVGDPAIGNQLNIATLPNPQNTFVEINSVNNETNWEYFRSNELGLSHGYDGVTSDFLAVKKSLTARAEVIPCSTYHLKLAIADRGDFSWDSGVFISELRGGAPNITIDFNSGIDYLIEDCTDVPDEVLISLNSPLEDTTTYNVVIEGSATLGEDYIVDLPGQVTFLPGQTEFIFPITVLSDMDSNEGIETIRISLNNDFGCGSVTYTSLDVELHDVLNIEINAGQDTVRVCFGGSVNLNAEGGAQYFWTPVSIFDNPSTGAPVATPTESGWVNVEGQIGVNCIDQDSIYLEVLDPSVEIEALDPVEICRGDSIRLQAINNVGNEGLSWSPAEFVDEADQQVVMAFPDNPTDIIATVTIAGCEVSDTLSVDVDFLNLPQIANDTTICQNYSVQLANLIDADTSSVVYSWTPAGTLNDAGIPDPVATPDMTTTYQLIATAENGACADTSSVTVTAIPADIDILSAGDTTMICLGETVDLTAVTSTGNAQGLLWTPDDGSISDTTGLSVIATPQVTTTYLASLTIGACTVFDSLTVQVDSLPQALDLTADPEKDSYCQGEIVTLTSPIFEPSDFINLEHQWIALGAETGDSLYNLVLTTQDTFTYQRITTSGACVDTAEITLNVIPNNAIFITPENPEICEGESVDLLVTGEMLGEITWEPSNGLSCTDCENPTASPTSSTSYTVTSDVDGCPVMANVVVAVNELPDVELIGQQSLCLADATNIALNNAGPEPGVTYTWTSTADPGFSSDLANPVVSPTESTTFLLSAVNACGETTGAVDIAIFQPPVIEAGEDVTTCIGSMVDLSGQLVSGGGGQETIAWIYDGNSKPGFDASFQAGNTGYAVLNYTYGPGGSCGTVMDSVLITSLNIAFDVTIESDPASLDTIYLGQEFTLTAVVDPPTGFDYSYSWMGEGVPAGANGSTVMVTAPLDNPGMYTYSVTVSIPEGCEESQEVDATLVEPEFQIPNVFTPNGDNMNDLFRLFIGGQVSSYEMMVYNRWGQTVFESTDLGEGWDGTYNGSDAPSDVYLYLIRFRVGGVDYEQKGDLTLIR